MKGEGGGGGIHCFRANDGLGEIFEKVMFIKGEVSRPKNREKRGQLGKGGLRQTRRSSPASGRGHQVRKP